MLLWCLFTWGEVFKSQSRVGLLTKKEYDEKKERVVKEDFVLPYNVPRDLGMLDKGE